MITPADKASSSKMQPTLLPSTPIEPQPTAHTLAIQGEKMSVVESLHPIELQPIAVDLCMEDVEGHAQAQDNTQTLIINRRGWKRKSPKTEGETSQCQPLAAGDGKSVKIWEHPWIPSLRKFKPISLKPGNS
ncbi:transducin family protein / WD-40 repeat family protein [Striga asiatica]|uniref:Transducin family protein / WD-40 repeat family protein n=1 Tax=Striga asiatica TaxID=4170 RepID=A0A5A7QV58_STRAF|nr:transducin family protein / WD-40 repeat family protein [Striga asiatica]